MCFVLSEFFKFHSIEQGLVDAVGDPAPKGRRVVILLNLPYGDRIYGAGKRTIHATRKRAQRRPIEKLWSSVPLGRNRKASPWEFASMSILMMQVK